MPIMMDRRALIATGAFGIGGLLLPGGRLAAQMLSTATGFTHGVASGEPGPDSMLLWTRYLPAGGGFVKIVAEVSETPDFAKIVAGGQMETGPWRDHTVKITVDGLKPGTSYYYRFIPPNGTASTPGRTRTLPMGRTSRFNMAIFSCSNIGFGYFNAYGHAAARDDIDVVLHMGDYIYEYARGGYDAGGELAKRIFPETEAIGLADYRLRYATYRLDPDLQALHARFPMICNTDDHEGANDAWEGGAQNHTPSTEGDWTLRKLAALQVWHEWMPVGDMPWKAYELGDLATYYRTDGRMMGRSRPHYLGEVMAGSPDTAVALKAFHDGAWMDPAATIMGTEQENWLNHAFRTAAREKKLWHVLGTGTNLGSVYSPPDSARWIPPNAPNYVRARVEEGVAAAKAGLPNNLDNWGGYPAARARLLKSAQSVDANLIAVTGDSHNAWGFDLPQDGKPAGVEFGGHSVTSPGYDQIVPVADRPGVAKALVESSPELRWMDAGNRGYMHLSLTPQAATNEWVFMDTVKQRTPAPKPGQRMKVRPGRKVLEQA